MGLQSAKRLASPFLWGADIRYNAAEHPTSPILNVLMKPFIVVFFVTISLAIGQASIVVDAQETGNANCSMVATSELKISRAEYVERLQGFWLGQCIANWTGLVTEMDRVGGDGPHGQFYTRDDWGKPDQPAFWANGMPSHLSPTIDFVVRAKGEVWGADDDTDIEYLYQHLLLGNETCLLTGAQIRAGWLKHIYSDENTPFKTADGKPENYLWVSNQRAHDLMREKDLVPPATSHPANNPDFDMIDAQLTTEIFGLFAPSRPDVALKMAHLPIRTTGFQNAEWAAEFYVIMHSLALSADPSLSRKEQIQWMAGMARKRLPADSYSASMYDFVKSEYEQGVKWEDTRDKFYDTFHVKQKAGYDIADRNLYANGGFASGINFGASIISLLYGEGDFKETIKIAVLCGWDSDNPAATWGGLLGFMDGKSGIEKSFGRKFSDQFNIHRTRGNFPNNGLDSFPNMAERGAKVVDRVVVELLGGKFVEKENQWRIPRKPVTISVAK